MNGRCVTHSVFDLDQELTEECDVLGCLNIGMFGSEADQSTQPKGAARAAPQSPAVTLLCLPSSELSFSLLVSFTVSLTHTFVFL